MGIREFFEYFFIIYHFVSGSNRISSNARNTTFLAKENNYLDAQIEEVIMATRALAETGALMVLEKTRAFNYSTTGTKLDARIHQTSCILFQSFPCTMVP